MRVRRHHVMLRTASVATSLVLIAALSHAQILVAGWEKVDALPAGTATVITLKSGERLEGALQNAGAASPMEGSVGLKVMTSIDEGRPYVMIQVTDSGGGIPEDDMPRVFTRLFRADNVLIQGVGDTGVGLSIAKTLTEAQNGRIWVESQAGAGATFSVLIPAVPDTVARLPGREAR